jgi:hypothetical protein
VRFPAWSTMEKGGPCGWMHQGWMDNVHGFAVLQHPWSASRVSRRHLPSVLHVRTFVLFPVPEDLSRNLPNPICSQCRNGFEVLCVQVGPVILLSPVSTDLHRDSDKAEYRI